MVPDASQGVQFATMQKLARYWSTEYSSRTVEARLNALPQFITRIDGLDIHFLARFDRRTLKIVDPRTNPTACGGRASEALLPS